MNFRIALILGVSSLALLGGCATSRSELNIHAPTAPATAQIPGKEILVVSVADRRTFEAAPLSPNIPSLDPNRSQDSTIKARAVGRKRGGFGKAHGDILLKEGQTVETLVANTIRQAFVEKGYRVIERKEQATKDTLLIEATVDKFWAWMRPGAWSMRLNAEISTELTLKSTGESTAKTVSVNASNNFPTIREENWIKVINRALRLYVDDLKSKID